MNYEKIFLISLIVLSLFISGCIKPPVNVDAKEIPKFASCSEIKNAFEASELGDYRMYDDLLAGGMQMTNKAEAEDSSSGSTNYSETNVQVKGVDEADIVKTDGKYIYALSNKNLVIAEAFPAEQAEILSKIDLGITPQEMFFHENNILIFGNSFKEIIITEEEKIASGAWRIPSNVAVVLMIDASNKEQPEIKRTIEFEGSYLNSRKIEEQVYFVINSYPTYYELEETGDGIIPLYSDSKENTEMTEIAKCSDIGYLTPVNGKNFITFASLSMNDFDSEIKKETVVGSAQNIYASKENLYLAQTQYNSDVFPLVKTVIETTTKINIPIPENIQETSIHKFSLNQGNINYLGAMNAPGTILNQFSMDEFEGNFRIATTTGQVSRSGGNSSNNIYVFGEDLAMKGKIEDLAPGEKIYSARFMGNKGYLVTFKKVDPLFVIDLSNAEKPKVLGKLKIPGYSDYLHPIDETHLIGIGKETIEAEEGDFAWYQEIKIAVFDVSAVEHPKEMYKEIIGDRGTESYALQEHKAFLYDKEKNLLVIPVRLAEITEEQKQAYENNNSWGVPYGEFVFQGAFVYNLSLENGFELKGTITHEEDNEAAKKSGYYYDSGGNEIKRSLFIEDALYTISNNKILVNSLNDLNLIKKLVMAETKEKDYYDEMIR